jgi:hypothetical protein
MRYKWHEKLKNMHLTWKNYKFIGKKLNVILQIFEFIDTVWTGLITNC